MSWPKGSEWRKWDLHVHSPASHNFLGDWNQFIIQIGNAECDVIGINDYFSIAGYKEVQRRLNDPSSAAEGNRAYRDALEKLRTRSLLPVVECRMNNVVIDKTSRSGPRINFHLIFSPEVAMDDIETFIRSLKVKGTSIGSRYSNSKFLLESVSVDFHETLKELKSDGTFANKFLMWIPYDEYGGIDNINPTTDTFFKEGLVYDADILGSSNKAQANFFLWKSNRFTEEQYRTWFGRRKPCIKGSDSHNVNDELGKLKDRNSKSIDRYCWIKADPTFNGLRQIINEPEDRVYIGRLPGKLEEVHLHPTHYLAHVYIRKTDGAGANDIWFDCEIPVNADMVAIIGNKGSGKSALADVLALAGNTHCDPRYFSFLNKDRFCERNGRLARQFEVEAVWADGTRSITPLSAKPDMNNVELIRYIPQTYLEKVCTETEPGEQSEFQRELRKVIFSHIDDAERLGRNSLEDLIDYKTEELTAQLDGYRQDVAKINGELVRLEAKSTADFAAQLGSHLRLKQQELEAHLAVQPAAVEQPHDMPPEQQAVHDQIATQLTAERASLSNLDHQIAERRARQRALAEDLAVAGKLIGRVDNLEADFGRFKTECTPEFQRLGLKLESTIALTIDRSDLVEKRASLNSEKHNVDATVMAGGDGSLVDQKVACEGRIAALQDQLDAPNKRYQAYQDAVTQWQQQKSVIEGTAEAADSLRYYEAQLSYVREQLPDEIAALKHQRRAIAEQIHQSIAAIKNVYGELFGAVQKLIEGSVIIKEGFRLTFDSSIEERTFQRDFFGKYVNQGVAGSFCGRDKGAAVLEQLRAEYDFNSGPDAIAFVEQILNSLQRDMRTAQESSIELGAQLRKYVEIQEVYDYLWSFAYLEPQYSLKLDGKDLNLLSPGERGTLPLVFYLLVDKSRNPIIVDQPEENLDNHTVFRLLIPVIKEVKKRRQIVMVTHSPNIAVVCDAEQIIHGFFDRAHANKMTYTTGSIESPDINKCVVDVLEGTRPAFDNRGSKYYP
jgi:ABC-type lipoprotein export system ATPase subunit